MMLEKHKLYKHHAFSVCDEIAQICKPLQRGCNISYISVQRSRIDVVTNKVTQTSVLCNAKKPLEFSLSHYNDTEPAVYFNTVPNGYLLIETVFPKWSAAMKTSCDIHNLIAKREKVGENEWITFLFGTASSSSQELNFYLNNLDRLDNFVQYFKSSAAKHLCMAAKNPIIIDHPAVLHGVKDQEAKRNSLTATKLMSAQLIDRDGRKVSVPGREMQCLCLRGRGRTAKEIAAILQISPRTVETYFEKSKVRLSCHTRREIMDVLELNSTLIKP